MTARLRRGLAAASVAVALAVGLASCATDPGISDERATGYRTQVVSIAESSAAGDYAEALGRLDALADQVDAAVADGTLDADRAAEITDAIALVRADLEAAMAAATPAPEPEPTEDAGDDGDAPGNSGDSGSNGNSGSGNGDDKPGKGKGRDKGDD
ncbi:hypothetical protein GCM10009819_17280 [Agromyces tropicus]|uniref:Mucin-associated surface protein n=1 Tax=Agromyces tropicus TaxID=555371 RepID=A0ABP5FTK1_9MICO